MFDTERGLIEKDFGVITRGVKTGGITPGGGGGSLTPGQGGGESGAPAYVPII